MVNTPSSPPGSARASGAGPRRWGRRIGQAAYYALAGGIALTASGQVFYHAFFPAEPPQQGAYEDCRTGLVSLYQAIVRGRTAARVVAATAERQAGDEQALRRYREELAPAWRHRDQVAQLCRADPELKGALDTIERLRYSEEHAVRSQAVELTALRRRVRHIVVHSLNAQPSP